VTRIAVVGHVEWVDFIEVERFPQPGEVLHARAWWARAAGGGGVAAAMLTETDAEVHFFCALGRDAEGELAEAQLRERGVHMHVAWRDQPTRRAVTLLQVGGERTIVTMGERLAPRGNDPLPWERLASMDGAYFTAGDPGALECARKAGVLLATPRAWRGGIQEGVDIDALVFSGSDTAEAPRAQELAHHSRILVATDGEAGGRWWGRSEGRWDAVPSPAEPQDSYGCGDSFAAGMTLALAQGRSVADAARVGAELGALALTRRGAP
jgi:ribokinase